MSEHKSKYTKKIVPFGEGVSKPIKTVGQLKKFLENYPDKLPLSSPYNEPKGIMCIWYNIGESDEHLGLEEAEGNCWEPGEF